MSSKKRGVKRVDRNKMVGPMTEFFRVESPEGAEEMGILATFQNNKYGVFVKKTVSDGFSVPGPNGQPMPMEIVHLIIVRQDKKRVEISWEEKQAIKNELLGPMCEGVELFPSEMRRMKTIPEHQCHLWVLQPGATMPVGLIPKAMQELARDNALEKFTVHGEELEVYLVEDDGVTQVFGSEEDARKSYEENDAEMPEGKVGRIGSVPTEDDGAAWSNLAKVKVASVLEKAEHLTRLMGGDPSAPASEQTTVNTNGPENDQDDLESEMGVVDESPDSDEENVMMPEFMKLGVEQMRRDRIASIGGAVELLEDRIEQQKKDAEEAEKDAAEAEVREAMAKDELAEMRRNMREERGADEKGKTDPEDA